MLIYIFAIKLIILTKRFILGRPEQEMSVLGTQESPEKNEYLPN